VPGLPGRADSIRERRPDDAVPIMTWPGSTAPIPATTSRPTWRPR